MKLFGLCVFCSALWCLPPPSESEVKTQFPGFSVFEKVSGDLNSDGYLDYAATLWKQGNPTAPIVIYFGDGHGHFRLSVKAPSANCYGCGGVKGNPEGPIGSLQIKKGILLVSYVGGSRNYWTDVYKWRFDKNKKDFVLIGETYISEDTLGQNPVERVDINFSTGKINSSVGKKRKTCSFKKKPVYLTSFDFDNRQPVNGCPN